MKRLSVAYLMSLFIAFAVVGVANSLLYALNLGEYRDLSFWTGRAEAGLGEFQARLLTVQVVCFVPLAIRTIPMIFSTAWRTHECQFVGRGNSTSCGQTSSRMGTLGNHPTWQVTTATLRRSRHHRRFRSPVRSMHRSGLPVVP